MSFPIIIRKYTPSDWSQIEAVHDEARKVELQNAGLQNAFLPLEIAAEREDLFAYEGIFVAQIDHAIVGFLACSQEELAWLYVSPSFMRKGVGRALVTYALSAFPTVNYVEVLQGNTPAIRLYESLGFYRESAQHGKMPGNEQFDVTVYPMRRTL